jgi:hypothetical protein
MCHGNSRTSKYLLAEPGLHEEVMPKIAFYWATMIAPTLWTNQHPRKCRNQPKVLQNGTMIRAIMVHPASRESEV